MKLSGGGKTIALLKERIWELVLSRLCAFEKKEGQLT